MLILRGIDGNPLEIIDGASGMESPFDHLPLHQVVGVEIPMGIGGCAIDMAGFAGILYRDGSGDGFALIIGDIKADIFPEGVQKPLKIFFGTHRKVVPLPGRAVDAVEIVDAGLFVTDAAFHPVFDGVAHTVAGLSPDGHKQIVLTAGLGKADQIVMTGLDGLMVFGAGGEGKSQTSEGADSLLVVGHHTGVPLEDVAVIPPRHLQTAVQQVFQGLGVVVIAYRSSGAVEQGSGEHRHLHNQDQHSTPQRPVRIAGGHHFILPVVFDFGPVEGLGESAVGMGADKLFIFGILFPL